ncbi:MAG: hypothetical protein NC218_02370 [Acetobacter sp.]|nr:hypothetical protein [Acetobacter sp.]
MQPVNKLQTLNSIISTPFVTAEFGGAQFGLRDKFNSHTKVRDVRYITSLTVDKKASGQVNTYSLALSYVVEPGADPNWLDLVISNSTDRKILFSYGDMSQPEYSYSKEQAIITKVTPDIQIASNVIKYNISATSSVALSYSIKRNFQARKAKPSTVIIEQLFTNTENGLLELFGGMRDKAKVLEKGWIATNDKEVYIDGAKDISPLDYLRLLVSKMEAADNSFFAMLIHDEPDNIDGPYFEVINSNLHQGAGNRYSVEIDVGYPSDTPVFSFTPTQNASLALITPYQKKYDEKLIMNVNEQGEFLKAGTPSLAIKNGSADQSLKTWWNTMTGYPVNATLRTRGLIKPSILCEYLDINVLFFGQPYNYSGFYMVTGQKDVIDLTGYYTDLSLVRVEGKNV